MREQQLIEEILGVAAQLHPEYTRQQQLVWTMGILAQTVLRKNHMDNKVFAELNARLAQLQQQ